MSMRLGVTLGGAGSLAAEREQFTAAYFVDLVRTAERGNLDFVTVPDSFARQTDDTGIPRGRLDALLTLARVAPATRSIGLVPEVTTTHTEPFHVSKNLATLDFVSGGRAGWKVAVSRTSFEADLFGRKQAAPLDELYREAAEFVDVVARLWDSWEDDAVIRDRSTGRYVDRDKLHYVDFDGEFFHVRGPSITPRSPQAHPVIAIDATEDDALDVAARFADIVFVDAVDADAARRRRALIRSRVDTAGRDPDRVTVLANIDVVLDDDTGTAQALRDRLDAAAPSSEPATARVAGAPTELADLLEAWWRDGAVDGFVVRPEVLPAGLDSLVDRVLPVLRRRGALRRDDGGTTFRDRLGLDRPPNRYADTA